MKTETVLVSDPTTEEFLELLRDMSSHEKDLLRQAFKTGRQHPELTVEDSMRMYFPELPTF